MIHVGVQKKKKIEIRQMIKEIKTIIDLVVNKTKVDITYDDKTMVECVLTGICHNFIKWEVPGGAEYSCVHNRIADIQINERPTFKVGDKVSYYSNVYTIVAIENGQVGFLNSRNRIGSTVSVARSDKILQKELTPLCMYPEQLVKL